MPEATALLPRAYGQSEDVGRRGHRSLLVSVALATLACAALSVRHIPTGLRMVATATPCAAVTRKVECQSSTACTWSDSSSACEDTSSRAAHADDDDACAAMPKSLCQTAATCAWRASNSTCFNSSQTTTAAASPRRNHTAANRSSWRANRSSWRAEGSTWVSSGAANTSCAAIAAKGECQTSSSCEWRSGACEDLASADDDGDACSRYEKTGCQMRATCQWRASDELCFNRTTDAASLAFNASLTAPRYNHSPNLSLIHVNLSKHPGVGFTGRNTSIDDDFWASARCSNTSSRAACENTAECAWSSCGFTCYDPATANASACASLARKGECQVASICEWRDSDSTCFSLIEDDDGCEDVACSSLGARDECESLSKCEWRASSNKCAEQSTAAEKSGAHNVSYEGASYCNRTIQKNTQSVANASGVFDFYTKYLMAVCQKAEECVIDCDSCGTAYRASLRESFGESVGCFGLHAVDDRWRTQGELPIETVVQQFTDAMGWGESEADDTEYHPFMDTATVLYTANLDTFAESWAAASLPFLRIRWFDDRGRKFYSLLTQTPYSTGNVEIVGRTLTDGRSRAWDDPHVRLPASAFSAAGINVSAFDELLPQPLAISKATSNLDTVASLYGEVLGSDVLLARGNGDYRSAVFLLRDADLAVRFVERPTNTTGFDVVSLEDIKRTARGASFKTNYCGMDRWYDNHFAWNRPAMTEAELVGIVRNLTRSGTGWHCSSDGLFIWEPTGDAIFVATTPLSTHGDDDDFIADVLSVCWKHGVDAADLCSQGYCYGDFANLTANTTMCTGKHDYGVSEDNHTAFAVTKSAHVSRNTTLDDDWAAERRCTNLTTQPGCEHTAQCEWSRSRGVCSDPTANYTEALRTRAEQQTCGELTKERCQVHSTCKWVASESTCYNASHTAAPSTNHSVNLTKHPNVGRVGRNQTIDDDTAAEGRCLNVTSRGLCTATAQCEWSEDVAMCYDPHVVNITAIVSSVVEVAARCTSLTQGECKQSTECDWSASELVCASSELASRRLKAPHRPLG